MLEFPSLSNHYYHCLLTKAWEMNYMGTFIVTVTLNFKSKQCFIRKSMGHDIGVNLRPNYYVIECLEKISVNEREMTIGI